MARLILRERCWRRFNQSIRKRGLAAPSDSPAAPVAMTPAPRTRTEERSRARIKAVSAVVIRAPPAAAPGIADPADLVDIRSRPACDLICLRDAVRHRRERLPGSERHPAHG